MDKETLSNYGWIVICVLVLAVMLALASPFGNFVADAIKSTTKGLFDVNQNALDSAGIKIMEQEFDTMLNGNNVATVPNGFTYTDAITGEVLGSGQQLPSIMSAGSQLTQAEGDYVYTLMKSGYETLEEARAYQKMYTENQLGMTWAEYTEIFGGEEKTWEFLTEYTGAGLTEDTFVPNTNPTLTWAVAVKDRTKTTYGEIYNVVLDYPVVDITAAFMDCTNLTAIPQIPSNITAINDNTFMGCTSLIEVAIPNGITHIGTASFFGCEKLTSISIPTSVSSIGANPFAGCNNLSTINYAGTTDAWNAIVFGNNWMMGITGAKVVCTDGTITLS